MPNRFTSPGTPWVALPKLELDEALVVQICEKTQFGLLCSILHCTASLSTRLLLLAGHPGAMILLTIRAGKGASCAHS
eukprot:c41880_g1_i1 orf=1-231(-)